MESINSRDIKSSQDHKLKSILSAAGFYDIIRVATTLQGSIWRACQSSNDEKIIIKVTNKYLHQHSISITEDQQLCRVNEDILKEASILKYLSRSRNAPKSIIKYHNLLESSNDYFLMMEDGGGSVFEFVSKAHRIIKTGAIKMNEWHKVCKRIFKQMIESIEYIHSKNICHFDISLENWVINDCQVQRSENPRNNTVNIEFMTDEIQIKLLDFGLSEAFSKGNFKSDKFCGKRAYQSPEIINQKRGFNAIKNDIWCLGICLFILIIGSVPFEIASFRDQRFVWFINGKFRKVFKHWNKSNYVNKEIINLFQLFFKYEKNRISLEEIKKHPWLL